MKVKGRAGNALTVKEFFKALPVALAPLLPFELRAFHLGSGRGRLIKLHFGHPETHFEMWHHSGAGKLEVGLHLEGSAELNAAALEFFRARMVEVKAGLPRGELEPWDRGWCRLYETFPAPELTDLVLAEGAAALAAYMTTLQPLVDEFWEKC